MNELDSLRQEAETLKNAIRVSIYYISSNKITLTLMKKSVENTKLTVSIFTRYNSF